jgi:hypothetical protein
MYKIDRISHVPDAHIQQTNILNQCIFQWAAFNKEQATVAKIAAETDKKYAWAQNFDWDSISRGCDDQLSRTEAIIGSDEYKAKLDNVLQEAKKKLKNG